MDDITGPADLQLLLRDFYGRAFDDDLLRHVFVDVAHMDLEAHIPVLAAFWEKVLLGTGAYAGRAMAVHRDLHAIEPLTAQHFERWLSLWSTSLDMHFRGPVATAAAVEATRIAAVFLRNLGVGERGAGEPGGLPILPLPSAPMPTVSGVVRA